MPAGAFVALIGPSGCGKSTLLRGSRRPGALRAGSAAVFGQPPAVARRQRDVAFCFQDATLFPWRSAIDNVRLPLQVGVRRPPQRRRQDRCWRWSGWPTEPARCRASCPAACASASRSPAPWSAGRSCC
ncbi:MAG: ATP-binding cassette domain-containing protein [Alphaproteobacteria bacterium]